MKNLTEEMGRLKNRKDFIETLKTGKKLQASFDRFKTEMIAKADFFNAGYYNYRFKDLFPQLDYFFSKEKSFYEYCSSKKEVILLGVEALLPLTLNEISISQIKDFRQLTGPQTLNFIEKISEKTLNEVMESSDEEGFKTALARFKDILHEKKTLLQKNYKLCKIQAGIKKLNIVCLAMTGISLLFPISFYEPALFLSGA